MALISGKRKNWSAVGAGLSSAALPGLGQFLSGAYGWGAILLGILAGILLVAGFARLWTSAIELVITIWALVSIYLIAAVHAAARFKPHFLIWFGLVPLFVCAAYGPAELALKASLRPTGFRFFVVPTHSMEPTIRSGDHIVADMHYYRNHAAADGDAVLILDGGIFLLKRVAAVPGETILGRRGLIYVNGVIQKGHYSMGNLTIDDPLLNFGPTTVPAGRCFLLGDNRNNSFDSRMPEFGLKPLSEIVGRPLYVIGRKPGPWSVMIN